MEDFDSERKVFAAFALLGLLMRDGYKKGTADNAFKIADEMLKASVVSGGIASIVPVKTEE